MKKYKIIATDNFDRESVADKLIDENLSKEDADFICEELNINTPENTEVFYKVVEQEKELYKPNLY